jgi:UDP-N-acetylglucosamine diphosphorylase/glucosamine-1-phosphate N-acetyltransferase
MKGEIDAPGGAKDGFCTIILAAGRGTRMKSDLAKVLHPLCEVPMLSYPVEAARAAGSERIAVVIGHQAEQIRETFRNQRLIFVEQREQLGTGHAVLQAREVFQGYDGAIVILCGDVPLIRPATVRSLYERNHSERAAVTVLTVILEEPSGYGRVVKTGGGSVLKIVEEKDATAKERQIREINTGIYCVESRFLFTSVAGLSNRNAQREYYLTDIIEIACKKGMKVDSFLAGDPLEVMGINTPEDLERAGRRMESQGLRQSAPVKEGGGDAS